MKTFLLIASAVFFHLPRSYMKHTIRKLLYNERMYRVRQYGMEKFLPICIFGYILGLGVALIPLVKALPIHWWIIVPANILYMIFVSPWVAFIIYPYKGYPLDLGELTERTIVFSVIGVILLVVGWLI